MIMNYDINIIINYNLCKNIQLGILLTFLYNFEKKPINAILTLSFNVGKYICLPTIFLS